MIPAIGQTVGITLTQRRKVYRFPDDRFTSYDTSDESWCRFFGIGEEVEVEEVTEFHSCVVSAIHRDGRIEFTGLDSYMRQLESHIGMECE